MRRPLLALVAGLGLALVACGGSGPPTSDPERPTTETTTAPTTTVPPEWAAVDRTLAAMGPEVGFLAARVTDDGTCEPVHAVEPATARPTASQFKLWVLGALAEQVDAGRVTWEQTVTVEDDLRSLGNAPESGSLQFVAPGTAVPVEEAATKMISISDNTATDVLVGLLGRETVEDQVARWSDHAEANEPFLTTRQMLLLHYVPGLAERYLAVPADERAAFLAASVDTLAVEAIGAGYSDQPRYVEEIEWFASPDDLCRTFAGLQQLAARPGLAPVATALSRNTAGIGLAQESWPTVWYKGGSEPGVLTMGWLATDAEGRTFVVEAMVSDAEAALAPEAIEDLLALAEEVFALLGESG